MNNPQNIKPKILLVPAGFEKAEGRIAKNLVKHLKGVDFYYFNAHAILKRQKAFEKLLGKVDAVHWLMNASNVPYLKNRHLQELSVPSIATVHHVAKDEEKKVEKAKEADSIHVIAKEWQYYLAQKYNLESSLAHLGVDTNVFYKNYLKRKPSNAFRIGIFGFYTAMNDRKRLEVLLEGLKNLKRKEKNFQVVLQGSFPEECFSFIEKEAIPYHYLGNVAYAQSFRGYRFLDIYLIGSDVEGGPFGVLEAMASGVPVIATPVGIAKEIIPRGGGILFNKNAPEEFCENLQILINERDYHLKLAKEALAISRNFDWRYISEKEFYPIYHELKGKREQRSLPNPYIQRTKELYLEKIKKL